MHIDHKGNKFKTKQAMVDYWGIPYKSFYRRIARGWTQERALSEPLVERSRPRRVKDHEGREFPSISSMAGYYGLTSSTLHSRLDSGWDIEEALLTPVREVNREIQDHKGQTFRTVSDMTDYWGIPSLTYQERIKCGWTVKKALTEELHPFHSEVNIDHKGNVFPTLVSMLDYWGIEYPTYRMRINKGMSEEEALTTELMGMYKRGEQIVDHTGQSFDSIRQASNHWGVNPATVRYRLKQGYTIKDALTHTTEAVDHEGTKFPSRGAMAFHWGISDVTLVSRLDRGISLEQALTVPPHGDLSS